MRTQYLPQSTSCLRRTCATLTYHAIMLSCYMYHVIMSSCHIVCIMHTMQIALKCMGVLSTTTRYYYTYSVTYMICSYDIYTANNSTRYSTRSPRMRHSRRLASFQTPPSRFRTKNVDGMNWEWSISDDLIRKRYLIAEREGWLEYRLWAFTTNPVTISPVYRWIAPFHISFNSE